MSRLTIAELYSITEGASGRVGEGKSELAREEEKRRINEEKRLASQLIENLPALLKAAAQQGRFYCHVCHLWSGRSDDPSFNTSTLTILSPAYQVAQKWFVTGSKDRIGILSLVSFL